MTDTVKLTRAECTLHIDSARLELLDLEGDQPKTDGVRKARGIANSGRPFRRGSFGNFAIDLESLQVNRADLPVLRDHDPGKIAGYTTSIDVNPKKGISVEMNLLEGTEHGRDAIALLEAGYPFQMSVYVPPETVERVPAGSKVKVNGHTLHGEGMVLRGSALREVTLTALGADERTGAAALSDAPQIEVEVLNTEEPMTENETAQADRLSAAELREQYPDVVAALQGEGATAERERIAAIFASQKGIDPSLVQTAVSEGWSADKARAAFLDYLQERKEARLEVIRDTAPEPVGTDDVETLTEGADDEDTAELAELEGDELFAAEFTKHGWDGMTPAELAEEFGQLEYYQAYRRNTKTEV